MQTNYYSKVVKETKYYVGKQANALNNPPNDVTSNVKAVVSFVKAGHL